MTALSRLLESFAPLHYDLHLDINGPQRRFSGIVTIDGHTKSQSNTLRLHAKDLTINNIKIDGSSATHELGNFDEVIIHQKNISAGEHTVTITFEGKITDAMHGLYPCYYTSEDEKGELFATQFESHHAREVFPCIDEPAAKATFDLELTTEKDHTVLSNMPAKDHFIKNDRLVTCFETTPKMSTYLLAFVIGDLQRKTALSKNGVQINVWATSAQASDDLDFALECAKESLDFYESYFDTPYPLPKCDHVALPDFSSGAMENWGLITYREIALLASKTHSSIEHRHHVALVIAHELAHQWFGNLVTMEWWNDLWLNESFANMMEYLSVDALHPDWNMWLKFSTNEAIMALRRDSIDGVQAVQVEVNHPDEIDALFDPAIVYAKGGRLLRMVQLYIGDDAFRDGLKNYFSKYAYKNTVGNDLWSCLEAASGKKISYIMNQWISQPGYPVISVARDKNHTVLSQQQFYIGPHEDRSRHWPVPLDANDSVAPKLLDSSRARYESSAPVRLNQSDSAHFITHYDDLSRQILLNNIKSRSLDTIGRLQLLHESTLLARGGILSSAELIPLIELYKAEDHEAVWSILAMSLADLRKFVEKDEKAEQKLRNLSAWVASRHYSKLGWQPLPNEDENDTKLRSTIIGLTLYGERQDAIEKALQIYDTSEPQHIDPEIRELVFSAVSKHGNDSYVDELLKVYRKTQSSELRHDICMGVTSTKNPDKIVQLLEIIKDPSIVKPQDIYLWFALLIRGRHSRTLAWQWLQDNWLWLEKTFAGDKSFDDFPRYVSSSLVTRKQLNEFRAFFEPKKHITALTRVITVGISEIEGRIGIIERDSDSVIATLHRLKID